LAKTRENPCIYYTGIEHNKASELRV